MGSLSLWLPRRGNSSAEYEDAFGANEATRRYAVADGATESCFAGLWARLLVEGFVRNSELSLQSWPDSIPLLRARWDQDVRTRTLPWYTQPGVEQGAFGTFLGVVLNASSDARCQWQAVAVGDTCLLHSRGDSLIRAFPLESSNEFGNVPQLVGSRMCPEDIRQRQSLWMEGCGQTADRLWMMTDALAEWCLQEREQGMNPWSELDSILNASEPRDRFTSWIEELRDARRLRNDDVTLLALRL